MATAPNISNAVIQRSAWDGLENLVAAIGGERDKRSWSVYGMPIASNRTELVAAYRSSWLAGKIIDIPVKDMTREWLTTNWQGRDDDQEDALAIEASEKRLGMRRAIRSGMRWGRLFGGCITAVIIKGANHAEPLDVMTVKKGSIASLLTADRWQCSGSAELTTDVDSPNLGLPVWYTLNESSTRIHWTRVVRWPGRELPYIEQRGNAGWDDSELLHIFESIKGYDTAMAAAICMLFEANVDIISADGLVGQLATKGGEAAVQKRYALTGLMKSFNKLLLLDKSKESFSQKTISFSGVNDILIRAMIDVSGAADIPTTRLFGQSPAGLSATGESDIRNYYDRLDGDREEKYQRPTERLYEIVAMDSLGYLPEGFCVEWNPLWQLSETEIATRDKTKADTYATLIASKIITPGLAARELRDDGTMSTMTDEDVEEAEELSAVEEVAEPSEPAANSESDPADETGETDTNETETTTAGSRVSTADAYRSGDTFRHDGTGWTIHRDGKRVGGPYKTLAKARRRMRLDGRK